MSIRPWFLVCGCVLSSSLSPLPVYPNYRGACFTLIFTLISSPKNCHAVQQDAHRSGRFRQVCRLASLDEHGVGRDGGIGGVYLRTRQHKEKERDRRHELCQKTIRILGLLLVCGDTIATAWMGDVLYKNKNVQREAQEKISNC